VRYTYSNPVCKQRIAEGTGSCRVANVSSHGTSRTIDSLTRSEVMKRRAFYGSHKELGTTNIILDEGTLTLKLVRNHLFFLGYNQLVWAP
jgi:hypothetical protein